MTSFKKTRRSFIKIAGLSVASMPTLLQACAAGKSNSKATNYFVYVGTYAKPDQDSIYGYYLNASTGELTRAMATKAGENPSFLTLDARQKRLYAVNEIGNFNGTKSGSVSAFSVNGKTGSLTLLNQQSSEGGSPCYISLDKTGKIVLAANYMGGNIVALPIQGSGQLSQAVGNEQHQGSSINKSRQEAPHAHCVITDPNNNYVFAVDLGLDQVLGYRLDAKTGQLSRAAQPAFQTVAGAGPRHLTFHPNGRLAFLICELNSTIMALAYNANQGTFTEIQTLPTLPTDFTGESFCADVHISPNGKFLYGSNRGHDSIAVFSIDAGTGQMAPVQHVSTQGKWPRNFAIDPSGSILLVANERSNDIFTYRIDPNSGQLTPTGFSAQVPKPVCLQVIPNL